MLLIDLSGEEILLSIAGINHTIDRKHIEKEFAEALLDLYKQKKFTRLYVIQGPASFTVVRIGVLLVNALVMLRAPHMKVYTLSKLAFYREVYKQNDHMGSNFLFFVGQRKNVRKVDYQTQEPLLISKKEMHWLPWTFWTDCGDLAEQHWMCQPIRTVTTTEETIVLLMWTQQLSLPFVSIEREQESILQPRYLIQPNIS